MSGNVMRIARALSLAGIDSRRNCERHVRNGAVMVNGEVIRDPATNVDLESDQIVFRGRALSHEKRVYYVLYKPEGYTTTAQDRFARKTVYDLLPRTLVSKTHKPEPNRVRVFPVGRLDKDSSGLLLFTNDGDLANHLTHPRYGVAKWYVVRLNRALEDHDRRRLLEGIRLPEGVAHAEKVQNVSRRQIRLMLREGKKREIRRMLEKLGYTVVSLCRTHFGPLSLGTLRPGDGGFLSPSEIKTLMDALRPPAPPER